MGFTDPGECPQLCKLAYAYLKKSKECDENIYEYFSSQPDADSLYVKLVEELDRCTLSYFAFYWAQASLTINQVPTRVDMRTIHFLFFLCYIFYPFVKNLTWFDWMELQVLSVDSDEQKTKLKNFVMAATR